MILEDLQCGMTILIFFDIFVDDWQLLILIYFVQKTVACSKATILPNIFSYSA